MGTATTGAATAGGASTTKTRRTAAADGPGDDGPRTPRGQRKRAVLVQAAREVFEDVGFRDARIADIASRAGASYGSLYFYFDSKEAIFQEVFAEFTKQMFRLSHVSLPVDVQ